MHTKRGFGPPGRASGYTILPPPTPPTPQLGKRGAIKQLGIDSAHDL